MAQQRCGSGAACSRLAAPPSPQRARRSRRALTLPTCSRTASNSYWIARCASAAARNAAATGCPDVPPQQARALMAEASAAEAGCRKVLPEAWVKVLDVPEATREAKRCIDKHMARGSPRAWIPRIVNAHEGALMPAPGTRGSVCAGCGKEGIGLRSCSACHSPQDRYCRCAARGLAAAGRSGSCAAMPWLRC